MEEPEIELFLSETLAGRYRPEAYLGSGEFAGAFLTRDRGTGEEVATKILKLSRCNEEPATREFRDEIALLGKLDGCDRVIALRDSGSHTVQLRHAASAGEVALQTQFAVLELAAGSLTDLLMHGAGFSWPDRLRLYRDVVKGVHQMHARKIVHRDVKADNGLVIERPPVAKVSDLGRAHDTTESPRFAIEAYLIGRGDVRFAPFEFLWLQGTKEAESQALADIYLLGSLLFEIATGVAFTAMVAPSPISVINANAALPESDRRKDWLANVPMLREGAQLALGTLAAELPAPIRSRTVALVEQLTDPDPARRVPVSRTTGAVTRDAWDLQWLLGRIDGLRRAIDPTFRRSYLQGRPRAIHGRPRARMS